MASVDNFVIPIVRLINSSANNKEFTIWIEVALRLKPGVSSTKALCSSTDSPREIDHVFVSIRNGKLVDPQKHLWENNLLPDCKYQTQVWSDKGGKTQLSFKSTESWSVRPGSHLSFFIRIHDRQAKDLSCHYIFTNDLWIPFNPSSKTEG